MNDWYLKYLKCWHVPYSQLSISSVPLNNPWLSESHLESQAGWATWPHTCPAHRTFTSQPVCADCSPILRLTEAKRKGLARTAIRSHRKHFKANVKKSKTPDEPQAVPWMNNLSINYIFKSYHHDILVFRWHLLCLLSFTVQAIHQPQMFPLSTFLGFMSGKITPKSSGFFKNRKI